MIRRQRISRRNSNDSRSFTEFLYISRRWYSDDYFRPNCRNGFPPIFTLDCIWAPHWVQTREGQLFLDPFSSVLFDIGGGSREWCLIVEIAKTVHRNGILLNSATSQLIKDLKNWIIFSPFIVFGFNFDCHISRLLILFRPSWRIFFFWSLPPSVIVLLRLDVAVFSPLPYDVKIFS